MRNSIFSLLLILSVLSCTSYEDEAINPDQKSPTSIKSTSSTNYKSFHFLRFNLVAGSNNGKSYLPQLKQLVKSHGGLVLTDGKPNRCVEGSCKSTNIVMAFPTIQNGISFSTDFQTDFATEIQTQFDQITYTANNNFEFDASVNVSSLKAFLVAEGDITDSLIFFNQYAPAAGVTIDQAGGNTLNRQSTAYQQCIIGNCSQIHAIVAFSSRPSLDNWYFSSVYQNLIPIRQSSTSNDATVLTQ